MTLPASARRRALMPDDINMTTARSTGHKALGGPRASRRHKNQVPAAQGMLPHLRDHLSPQGSVNGLTPSGGSYSPQQPATSTTSVVYSRDEIERLRLIARKQGFPHLAVHRVDEAAASAATVMHLKERPKGGPGSDACEGSNINACSPPLGKEPDAATSEQLRKQALLDLKANRLAKIHDEVGTS